MTCNEVWSFKWFRDVLLIMPFFTYMHFWCFLKWERKGWSHIRQARNLFIQHIFTECLPGLGSTSGTRQTDSLLWWIARCSCHSPLVSNYYWCVCVYVCVIQIFSLYECGQVLCSALRDVQDRHGSSCCGIYSLVGESERLWSCFVSKLA